MASVQARRENVTDERGIVVEKDRVPKMATHFESLAGKAREEQQYVPSHGEKEVGSGLQVSGTSESESERKRREEGRKREGEAEKRVSQVQLGGGEGRQRLSLEEISNFRATAQQNSTEAISAAEEQCEKAKAAKDTTQSVAGNVGEKAVAVESGKGAVGFVGKVAAEVKDQAVVAGWGTTQYTLEKVAEATVAVADMTSSVAGYTGEAAVAAKDKVAGAGKTMVSYAGGKIAAATDAVVAAEEKAAEYAARKKVEAQEELEARRASHEMGDREEMMPSKKQYESKEETEEPPEKFLGTFQGGAEEQDQLQQGGSILRAIGETILEIGQTTKALLTGQNPIQVLERNDEAEFVEYYPASGKGT